MTRLGWSMLLCAWLGGLAAQAPCDALHPLRMAYLDHSTFEQAEETENLALTALTEATGRCAVLIEAHRWVSHARSADFGWNPRQKFSRLNTGLDQLDALVEAHPKDDVLRALRLSITGTAPRWLRLEQDWREDLAALRRLLAMDHWAESPKFSAWMSNLAEQIEQERS